jgi:hypothetical protein
MAWLFNDDAMVIMQTLMMKLGEIQPAPLNQLATQQDHQFSFEEERLDSGCLVNRKLLKAKKDDGNYASAPQLNMSCNPPITGKLEWLMMMMSNGGRIELKEACLLKYFILSVDCP